MTCSHEFSLKPKVGCRIVTCKGPNAFKFLAGYIAKCIYVHGLVLQMQVAITVEVRVID